MWSFIVLNLLSTLSVFAQIKLHSIPSFLESGLGSQYAVISAADSNAIPSIGKSKNFSSILVRVVLIAPVIIIRAALRRRSSSDLAKAISILSYHATVTYMILGIITGL